MYSWALVTDSF